MWVLGIAAADTLHQLIVSDVECTYDVHLSEIKSSSIKLLL